MEQIFTSEEIQILQKSAHRRASNKCFQCRYKRIECSYEFPKCATCQEQGVECYAWAKGIKKPIPRSLSLFLEDKVASLEIELEKLKRHSLINDEEEQSYLIAKYTSTPFLGSFLKTESKKAVASFSRFFFNSSNLPSPFDQKLDSSKRGNMSKFIRNNPPVDLKSIPDNVMKIMMSNYMEFHLPQYPILSRPKLTEILEKALSNPNNTDHFERAVISITMAISAALIKSRSEKRALSSSSALFSASISEIMLTKWDCKMRKLEMTLLVAHYGFSNPYAVNVWHALRYAFHLCLDMGLHKEVQSEAITVLDVDDRRRLFMVCSGMLRHLSAVLKVKFPLPHALISVEYPTIVDDSFITEHGIDYSGPQTKAAALHFYTFRLCETEVCDVLWYNKEIPVSVEDWVIRMEQRVEEWYIKAEEFAKINQLRFRLICKASLKIRLRRRTPRIPQPTRDSFVQMINAVALHVDEYVKDINSGQVSYLLMGVHYMTEAAINLLDVMWFESAWILEFFTIDFLVSKIQDSIQLLNKFGERWPDVKESKMVDILESLTKQVIMKLQKPDDINQEVFEKVSSQIENLIFSHHNNLRSFSLSSASPHAVSNTDINGLDPTITKEDYLSESFFSDKSNWNDHFIGNSFWNLEDLLNQLGDYF